MLRTEFSDFTAVSQHRTDAEKGDTKNMVVSVGILIDDQVVARPGTGTTLEEDFWLRACIVHPGAMIQDREFGPLAPNRVNIPRPS
jgi:hypothetical protein